MTALLEITALEFVAGGSWLLRDVSLRVEEGSSVAVVGGARAGKTLLFELVLGLATPRGGRIRLDGRDAATLSPIERQHLGLRCAFQLPPLFPGLSVREHLGLAVPGGRLERRPLERLLDYLPELADRLDQPTEALAPAPRRLVDIGRALLGLPRLLLIDELFPALGGERAAALIQRLRQDGYTLLLADRYGELALGQASYGYVLAQGRIRAEGRPDLLRDDPRLLAACAGDLDAYADEPAVHD